MCAAPRLPASAGSALPGPTLRDLARQLGVSRTTVSLALNHHRRIPAATQQRICAAAAQLGYRPDPKVSRLMAYLRLRRRSPEREVIAVINAFPTREPWRTNTHLRTMRDSLCARALDVGFAVEDFWLGEPGMTALRLGGILRARGIAGLVLLPFPQFTESLDFSWPDFACTAIGHSVADPLHRICPHQYRDLNTALRALRALGYRRPGLVLNPDLDRRVEHYYMASYLYDQYSQPRRERLAPLLFTEGREQFLRWFERQRPDVLLLSQPPPARADVQAWLARLGRRCPRDYGLALLDLPHDDTATSGIRQAYGAVAAAAIDVVVGQLSRGERGLRALPQITKIEGEWRAGRTTRQQ